MKRTHTCGQLTSKETGKAAILTGWVSNKRDHGGLTFIDLRDRYGITQVVFNPDKVPGLQEKAKKLGSEFVILVKGKVSKRPKGTENKGLPTGAVELIAEELEILNESDVVPLEVKENTNASEEVRLKYRYLDLRRHSLQKNIILRHRVVKTVRDYLDSKNFIEVETPILAKSTPEGARDYLVPSRVHPGKFFALPQSPQLFKQLLMVSGFDRYFQVAKCFRDEDLRADRQPEFTQLDAEMSFIDEEDIYALFEGMIKEVYKEAIGITLKTPFPRMTYDEAISRFGVDNPDLRYGLELTDVSNAASKSSFNVFKEILSKKGKIKSITAKSAGEKIVKKDIEELEEVAKTYKAKGLAALKVTKDGFEGFLAKFFDAASSKELIKAANAKPNDMLLIVADADEKIVAASLGNVRKAVARKLNLIDEKKLAFTWIVEFPLFEWSEEEQHWNAMHHPFTSPRAPDLQFLDKEPYKAKARSYDLVLNGVELGGGSIRIHRSDVQQKMFRALGITEKEAQEKFGFLLEAFKYGAPPHGGIAFGLDRVVMLLSGADSIREVIAFPKNKAAVSLMDNAPSEVSEKQLKELRIRLDIEKVNSGAKNSLAAKAAGTARSGTPKSGNK